VTVPTAEARAAADAAGTASTETFDEVQLTAFLSVWRFTYGSEFDNARIATLKVFTHLKKYIALGAFPSPSTVGWRKIHRYDASAPEKSTVRMKTDGTISGEVGDLPNVHTTSVRAMVELLMRLLYSYALACAGMPVPPGRTGCPHGLAVSRDNVELFGHANLVDELDRLLVTKLVDSPYIRSTEAVATTLDQMSASFRLLMGPRGGNHTFSSACYHVRKNVEIMLNMAEIVCLSLRAPLLSDATSPTATSKKLSAGGTVRTPRSPAPSPGKKVKGGDSSSAMGVRMVGGNPASPHLCHRSEADCGKYTGVCYFNHSQKPEPSAGSNSGGSAASAPPP
jgi:hypothetical protein